MVIQYKCPDCGADMTFNSTSGKLHCDSCGHEEEIGKMEGDFEPFKEQFHETTFGDEKVVQYQCKNCGAILITDQDTTATTCSFCGSPVILGDRLSGILAPTKVIPFHITKQEAQTAFKKWTKKCWLSPDEFKQAVKIKELVGIYVPFWLFDTKGQGDALAKCSRTSSHNEGDYTVTETAHYDVYRKMDLTFRDIPADASEKMADDLMDHLEPFDYSDMKDFNTPYLAGYLAEKYNYTDKELFPRIQERVATYMDDYILSSIHGYSSVHIDQREYHIGELSAEYALMPIWMVYYSYKNAEYTFAMNGQTGRLAGMPPISKKKVVLFGSLILLGIFILLRLITILMGGPVL